MQSIDYIQTMADYMPLWRITCKGFISLRILLSESELHIGRYALNKKCGRQVCDE